MEKKEEVKQDKQAGEEQKVESGETAQKKNDLGYPRKITYCPSNNLNIITY